MSPPPNRRLEPQASSGPAEPAGVQMIVLVTSGDGVKTLAETTRLLNGRMTHQGGDPVKLEAGKEYRIHLTMTYCHVRDKDYSHSFNLYRQFGGNLVVFNDYKTSPPGWSSDRIFPDDPLASFARQFQLYLKPLEPGAYRFILKSWKIADRDAVLARVSGRESAAELEKITTVAEVNIQVGPLAPPG